MSALSPRRRALIREWEWSQEDARTYSATARWIGRTGDSGHFRRQSRCHAKTRIGVPSLLHNGRKP